MPYRIKNTGKGAKPFKVVNEVTGKVKGSHATKKGAVSQMRLLYMIERGDKPTRARRS